MREESAVFKVKMRRWRGEREEAERWRSAIQKQAWVLIGCSGVWADVHVSWYGMVWYGTVNKARTLNHLAVQITPYGTCYSVSGELYTASQKQS